MGAAGIPLKLLSEAQVSMRGGGGAINDNINTLTHTVTWPKTLLTQGHVVTVELTSGHTYRGKLIEGEYQRERREWEGVRNQSLSFYFRPTFKLENLEIWNFRFSHSDEHVGGEIGWFGGDVISVRWWSIATLWYLCAYLIIRPIVDVHLWDEPDQHGSSYRRTIALQTSRDICTVTCWWVAFPTEMLYVHSHILRICS